jgi:MFS family permease
MATAEPEPVNTATAVGGPAEFEAEKAVSHSPEPVTRQHGGLWRHETDDSSHTDIDSPSSPCPPTKAEDDEVMRENNANALTSVQSHRRNSKEIISFLPSSPEHPQNWPRKRKLLVFATGIMTVLNSTMGSSLPSNAVPSITTHFNVTNDLQFSLPISCFLMGYVIGPILCGPLSENYGRKPIMVGAFCAYIVWTMACAIAPTWPALLVFRLLCGIFASAPIAIVGGLYADIYGDPRSRGAAMAYFMVATTLGPIMAPIVSGFIAQSTSWRWVFGAGTFFALATLPLPIICEETYLPVLLERKARQMRKEQGRDDIIAATSLEKKSWSYVFNVVMTRPFRMLFQEAIVGCVCLYAMLVYAIFYLYFGVYPLIFLGETSVYNFSPGIAGLTFIAIMVGSMTGLPIFIWWDRFLARKQAEGAAWAKQEEYRRLPLACLGGPMFVLAIFWLGWSARADVHWIVPVLSGIPFGCAYLLIFMALLNYLSDAYLTFAASAQGMASTCRSLGGATLPIAGRRMFTNLGIAWACSLLAFVALGVAVIPFVFIRYGEKIRANSKFCQELRRIQEEDREAEKREEARQSRHEVDPGHGGDEKRREDAVAEV